MAVYTPGLASGFDWTSMLQTLVEVERRPITLMERDKDSIATRQTAWSDVNTKLLALKSSASSLSEVEDFDLFSSSTSITGTDKSVGDLVKFAVGSNASAGSYSIEVKNLAQAQKLGSRSFSSTSDALNLSGDILINGRAVNIEASDNLSDLQSKINALNSGANATGVTASIFTVADGEYRLTLTSQNTGAEGIDIANASNADILGELGIADSVASVANPIAGGARSSGFSSSTEAVGSMLGLSSAASGTVKIAGVDVVIDLATDTLEDIRAAIDAVAGVSASIVSDTSSGEAVYTLQIDGTQDIDDNGTNVMQALGVMRQGHDDVTGVTGNINATTNGAAISGSTLLVDIDGYGQWTSGDKITIAGNDHDGAAIIPRDFVFSQSATVDDLLGEIRAAYGDNVTAYVNADGAIVVEDNQSGASSLSMTLTSSLSNGSLDFGTFASSTVRQREIVAGEDAQIVLDGVTINKSSNQISDVIGGVTIDLKGEEVGATVNLNIERDFTAIKGNINNFVDSYNEVMKFINAQFAATGEGEELETPPLFADASLLSVKSDIRSQILNGVEGVNSSFSHLSLVGVSIDEKGLLSVDDSKLDGYLRNNFSDMVNLFTAQGSSTNSNLTYVSSDKGSQSGSYEVQVTQAATQSNATGTVVVGALSANSSLTITDHAGNQATVNLNSSWNITSIVNAINSEMSQSYNQVLVGANKLYADENNTAAITASTTWDSVYSEGVAPAPSAGIADNDKISFSGTDRNGRAVSGEYTISSAATDTVGGLLDEIENTFGSGYNASIDGEGRIVIEDTTAGNSQLSLIVGSVKNLDFGAVDNGDSSDGSQVGRYSLDITAVNDGGKLKIYNSDYGAYGLTVVDNGADEMGINGTAVLGADIQGQIRKEGTSTWMTMTGKGQTLTGDDDQDVEDLVIKYTGSATGTYDFDFTVGVGEMMDRSLFYMTDSIDGYVAGKQESLDSQIRDIDDRIAAVERRVSVRETALFNQFVNMEKMLAQLQAQQSWLSGIINSLG